MPVTIFNSQFAMWWGAIHLQIPTQVWLIELLLVIFTDWISWEADSMMEITVYLVYYRFIGINTLEGRERKQDFSEGENELDPWNWILSWPSWGDDPSEMLLEKERQTSPRERRYHFGWCGYLQSPDGTDMLGLSASPPFNKVYRISFHRSIYRYFSFHF